MVSSEKKIIGIASLKEKLSLLKKQGWSIVFTNGCFDLMHFGHVQYLETAKSSKGKRVLVVGLNSDRSVRHIKGPQRPICPQRSRAALLAALSCVDFVVIFNEDTPYNTVKALKPDVLVKGADWKGKPIIGEVLVKKVELIKYVRGFSTTHIIKKIAKVYGCR